MDVFEKVELGVKHQIIELDAKRQKDLIKIPQINPQYKESLRNCFKIVSSYAIYLSISGDIEKECTGWRTRVYGLPCVHLIHQKALANEIVDPYLFHQQWHLNPNPSLQVTSNTLQSIPEITNETSLLTNLNRESLSTMDRELILKFLNLQPHQKAQLLTQISSTVEETRLLDPDTITSKGRPKGIPKKSTKRNPSFFEIVEKEEATRRKRGKKKERPAKKTSKKPKKKSIASRKSKK